MKLLAPGTDEHLLIIPFHVVDHSIIHTQRIDYLPLCEYGYCAITGSRVIQSRAIWAMNRTQIWTENDREANVRMGVMIK